MSQKLTLYNADLSPPVRVVKIVSKVIGLDLELRYDIQNATFKLSKQKNYVVDLFDNFRDIDLVKGEHLQESYVKLNPEHTVPTLVDGDFVIWDSHAICMYLADKYCQNDKLYPKDLQLRAKCNQRLFFDAGTLYTRLRDCSIHIFFNGGTEISLDKIEAMHTAYSILEQFLASDPFLVGNDWTIADVSVAMTISCLEIYAPVENDKYPNIFAWLKRVTQTIPFFDEINSKPLEMYRQLIQNVLAKNKQK